MPEQKKPVHKKIEATDKLKEILADYFFELDEASRDKTRKIAWCTSVGPAEILRSLGFLVYFPENHGALLGATRTATDCIPVANAVGYSPDICSYLTSDIGAFLKGFTPLSKAYPGIESVPKPDVLVYNTNQCRDVWDWLAFYAREFDVPLLGIETYRGVGKVTETHVHAVAEQMRELVPPLEKIAGKSLDPAELERVVGLSLRTSRLWREVLETATHSPAPLTFFDGTIHMAPAVVLRGTETANEYYEILLSELKSRVSQGVGAVEGESFRLYWDGMPIWGRLRSLSELFVELKTCLVASTYCNSWIFEQFDPSDPFNSMARAYTELFIVRSEDVKEAYIEEMIGRFRVDGLIFHDSKTCPNNSNNRYGMPQRIKERLKCPAIVINGDLNDLRCLSDEQVKTSIEAFIEQLAEGR
jgi:benzoyl-CoA reductase/2-hydroxyglutaryl-CoA dehydratase subunit BcrC/BadD/HgdB